MTLLSGSERCLRVRGGDAYIYAVRIEDGAPAGRYQFYMHVADGSAIPDFRPEQGEQEEWGCLVRLTQGAALEALSPGDADAPDRASVEAARRAFSAFVERARRGRYMDEAQAINNYRQTDAEMMSDTLYRLDHAERVNAWEERSLERESPECLTCRRLGKYMGVEIVMPPQNGQAPVALTDILRQSGLRYQQVRLDADWWKKDCGAMIGTLSDGAPVALLPLGLRGYRMFDPRVGKSVRVGKNTAKDILLTATAVYRTFPSKPLRASEILRFVAGEHIYLEIGLILLFSFLAALVQVLQPILSAQVFDMIVPEYMRGLLVQVVLILLAFGTASLGFSVIVNMGFARVKNKLELSLQAGIWDRLISQRIPFFFQFTSGELLEKIKGINKVKGALSLDLFETFLSVLFSFVNIYVMFRYSPEVTPYVLWMFLFCIVLTGYVCRRIYALNQRIVRLDARSTSLKKQLLGSMQRIKASRAEERAWSVVSARDAGLRALKTRVKRLDAFLDAFCAVFQIAGVAVVYLMISRQSGMEMGAFVAYLATYAIAQNALMGLLKVFRMAPELLPVMREVGSVLQTPPESAAGHNLPMDMDGTISVDNVSFRYTARSEDVLKGVSFSVGSGESVGIVGFSGCGKSTLLGLILGLYAPTGGKVYLGGHDADTLDMERMRRRMGIVTQHGALTVGDIFSNLQNGNADVDEQKAIRALTQVDLIDVVNALPDGIHTRLEEHDGLFSEGQMQLLMVARAIVGDPAYLLLDESTSWLDNLSQAQVVNALDDVRATKIIVAQRLESVRHCDRIVLLENGRVVDVGNYRTIRDRLAKSA